MEFGCVVCWGWECDCDCDDDSASGCLGVDDGDEDEYRDRAANTGCPTGRAMRLSGAVDRRRGDSFIARSSSVSLFGFDSSRVLLYPSYRPRVGCVLPGWLQRVCTR